MKTKYAIIMAGLALLLLLALACTEAGIGGSIGASTAGDIGTDAAQPGAGTPEVATPAPEPATPAPAAPSPAAVTAAPPAPVTINSFASGISVTGEGTVTVEPDLAILNIGVETRAETVSVARNDASVAMDAIMAAVKEHGLTDADIQTTSFSVRPRYDYQDGVETLIAYRVNHHTTMKARDLDAVGEIIDDVAEAGGDAIRINGISFTVEDRTPFTEQLREAAVEDAMAKARHYAELTGVELGSLIFLTESGADFPPSGFRAEAGFAFAMADSTSVSGGELALSLTVQAVFGID